MKFPKINFQWVRVISVNLIAIVMGLSIFSTGSSQWTTPVIVDNDVQDGGPTKLVINDEGNPAILYVRDDEVYYVQAEVASGNTWNSPVKVSQYMSGFEIVNGNPALSYSIDDLTYQRALDANGINWGDPIVIDDTCIYCEYSWLEINASGVPAISYSDRNNHQIKYIQAKDANGDEWNSPSIVYGDADAYGATSLVITENGFPAISYFDQTTGDLKYSLAKDINGSAWNTPVIIDQDGYVGSSCSLMIVNGNPAVVYYDHTNLRMKYVRAFDTEGKQWGTPIALGGQESSNSQFSTAVLNGLPVIVYGTYYYTDLMFIQAMDANGESWDTPVTLVTGANSTYQNPSMVASGGTAWISYYDKTNKDLKILRYSSRGCGTTLFLPLIIK